MSTEYIKGGLSLNFYPTAAFESLDGVEPSLQTPIMARNLWRLLTMGWSSQWKDLINWDTFSAAFISRDPALLKVWRAAYQQGLLNIFEQLKNKHHTDDEIEQIQLYLSNCLSLFPYTDPNPYEFLRVPQYSYGSWDLVEYKVEPIELTETSGFYKTFDLQENDRVFAYGLVPLNPNSAQSHLIFAGTTYPAGQGFVTQVTTDLKGFETVGKSLYLSGRDRLKAWLDKCPHKPHVCGVSLGGSLSLLIAREFGNLIDRVDALNPAGLHDSWIAQSPHDKWDDLIEKPRVIVQREGEDPVSKFGVWKKDWTIVDIKPPKNIQGPADVIDHVINYVGNPNTRFYTADPCKINEEQWSLNVWLYSLARGAFYYLILAPYNFVIRPVINLLWNNIWLTLAAVVGGAICLTLSLLSFVPALFAGIAAATWLGSIVLAKAIHFTVTELTKSSPDIAAIHDPKLPRNLAMDLYNSTETKTVWIDFPVIHQYYKVMRELVRGKEFITQDMDPDKKRLLENSSKEEYNDFTQGLVVTRAKAHHIYKTLGFIEQLGMENKEKLKEAVSESYAEYRLGKPAKLGV